MKSKILSIILLLATFNSQAQFKIKAGPELGVGVSSMSFSSPNSNGDFYMGPFIQIGGTAELQFGRWFEVRPSIMINSSRNYSSDEVDNPSYVSTNSVYIPVDLLATFRRRSGFAFFLGLGPYFTQTYSGKNHYYYYDALGTYVDNTRALKLGNGKDKDLQPFDFGLNLKIGIQARSNLFVNFSFNLGLTNRSPKADYGVGSYETIKSQQLFGCSIGYLLGSKEEDTRRSRHGHHNSHSRHYRR